jgi:hypothetical protein
MHEVTNAIRSVEHAVTAAPQSPSWRALVSNRLAGLRGAYIGYLEQSVVGTNAAVEDNPWLSARLIMLRRDQARVADEIDRLIDMCNDSAEVEVIRREVDALLGRIARSRQRERDLIYESVDMELGGEQ